MGRRKPAAAFSLFSFQDIVTSVTAILILVMLLLSIELVSRRRQQAASDPNTTRRQMAATAKQLETLAVRMREEVAARRERRPSRSMEAAQRELARVRAECDATQRRLEEIRQTQAAVAVLREQSEALASAHAADADRLAQLMRQVEEDRLQADRGEEANREERERQTVRRREVVDRPRSGTELVYNPQAGSKHRAWLVELSAAGITAVLLGGDRTERLGLTVSDGSAARHWIDELNPDLDYCLLLIRPSCSASLDEEVSTQLRDKGIRHGIDLIGEDQTVRDGTKSAPPPS